MQNSCKVAKLFRLLVPGSHGFFQEHLLPASPARSVRGTRELGGTLELHSFLTTFTERIYVPAGSVLSMITWSSGLQICLKSFYNTKSQT